MIDHLQDEDGPHHIALADDEDLQATPQDDQALDAQDLHLVAHLEVQPENLQELHHEEAPEVQFVDHQEVRADPQVLDEKADRLNVVLNEDHIALVMVALLVKVLLDVLLEVL